MKRVAAFVAFLTVSCVLSVRVTALEPKKVVVDGYNCEQVYKVFKLCVEYLIGGNGPSTDCCQSVSQVKSSEPTAYEPSAACKCFQQVAIRLPQLNLVRFASLPKACAADLGFPLTKNTDCTKVS